MLGTACFTPINRDQHILLNQQPPYLTMPLQWSWSGGRRRPLRAQHKRMEIISLSLWQLVLRMCNFSTLSWYNHADILSSVPLAIALVIFLVLHRRHVKKMRLEDQNDPHKSLDFGLDPANPKRKKKGGKGQEMMQTDFEKSLRRGRGLSMDLGDISNPYVLPPGMQSSRESLHSLSRIAERGVHDPYRPATIYSSPGGSPYPSSRFDDSSSTRTGSTGPRFGRDGMNSNSNLLRNAQRMPVASPASPSGQGLEPIGEQENHNGTLQEPPRAHLSQSILKEETRESYAGKDAQAIRQSNNYLAGFIQSQEATNDRSASKSPEQRPVSRSPPQSQSPPPVFNFSRKQSLQSNPIPSIAVEDEPLPQGQNHVEHMPMPQDYTSRTHSMLSSPTPEDSTPFYTPTEKQEDDYELDPKNADGLGVSNVAFDSNKRLSIMRPLPPDDPTDNAEQRANRIRSFYKEYFRNDEPARAYQPNVGDYYEDYGQEYLGDGTMYDPETGQFIVAQAPFAEPVTRRAMTPPPRGPPRFQGRGSPYNSSTPNSPVVGRSRAFSTVSTGRMGPGAPRGAARRPLPPPAPLRTLPTPYLLKDDAFLTTLPIDFAPPSNFRDQAAARPQSPRGEMRPYSPQVPIASPLASSFSELPAMPSP